MLPDLQKSSALLNVSRLRPFVLVRQTCRWKSVWRFGGMTQTGEKAEYSENNLSQCHLVHNKSHVNRPGIESEVSRWKAGEYPPETRHGLCREHQYTLHIKTKFGPDREHNLWFLERPAGEWSRGRHWCLWEESYESDYVQFADNVRSFSVHVTVCIVTTMFRRVIPRCL